MVIKLISIFISSLILFQSSHITFSDMEKLDELIEHSIFHSDEFGDSFFVFLSKHYGELKLDHNDDYQKGNENHENLPFQQHQCQTASAFNLVLNNIDLEFKNGFFTNYDKLTFYSQDLYSSFYIGGIFQPPKYV